MQFAYGQDFAPIIGCIIRPESGPARNTTAMLDFDSPRDNRYGEAASENEKRVGNSQCAPPSRAMLSYSP